MIENFKNEFINGIQFEKIADYVWNIDRKDLIPDKLSTTKIIFCKTDYLEELFNILEKINSTIILITHCSDHAVSKDIFLKRPTAVKKWFGQNINHEHEDLIPIPLGIENHIGSNKGKNTNFEFLFDYIKPFPITNKIINKIYCNFNFTHWNRQTVANQLIKQGHPFLQGLPFNEYIIQMQNFLFVASPRGNGIDCHRTWEALYAGCIPIVEKHFMYNTYNLPILQIDNWENLDQNKINEYIASYKNNNAFKFSEQLSISWWFNKILQLKYTL